MKTKEEIAFDKFGHREYKQIENFVSENGAILEAMEEYANQSKCNVSDEEIETKITDITNAYDFAILKKVNPKLIDPLKRLIISIGITCAKWMRDKITSQSKT